MPFPDRHGVCGRAFFLCPLIAVVSAIWPVTASAQERDDMIVITADEIAAMKANRMEELLNHVPGVSAGDSSISIHGSSKVRVFLDGRPINDPTSSTGGVTWYLVTPQDVERIEIIRDKGAMKYGQDASAGVILITTRTVQTLSGNVKAYGGNQETGYGQANLRYRRGGLGVGINGGGETTGGYTVNNDKTRYQGGGRLSYDFTDSRSLALAGSYILDERGLAGQPAYPTPHSRKESRNLGLSLRGVYDRTTSTTYYNRGSQHNTDVSRNLDQKLRVAEMGEELSTTLKSNRFGEAQLGGAFKMFRASGSSFDATHEETYSLYAAQSLRCAELGDFSLYVGVRVNFNTAFDNSYNPEIKLVYTGNNWNASAGYGRANNTPSFYQRYNRTSSTIPNPSLDMEVSDNFNLSFFARPHEAFSGSVSLFYNRLKDRITYVSLGGVGQYQNFGRVTYRGGDLALDWKPHQAVNLKASYIYMEAKDQESGKTVTCKPRHTVKADLYLKPFQALTAVISGKYTSMAYIDKNNTRSIPGYFLLDLRGEYSVSTTISLFAEIENLLDKDYLYVDGLQGPSRTWILGMNVKF